MSKDEFAPEPGVRILPHLLHVRYMGDVGTVNYRTHLAQNCYGGQAVCGIINTNSEQNGYLYTGTGHRVHGYTMVSDVLRDISTTAAQPWVIVFKLLHSVLEDDTQVQAHDLIKFDDFVAGESDMPYTQRWAALHAVCRHRFIQTVHSVSVYSHEQAEQIASTQEYGIVVRDRDAGWKAAERSASNIYIPTN